MTHPRKNEGFALVIALTLLALMVMIAIGLSSLVQIELRSAGFHQKEYEARENARLGMMVALGQLQQLAGPDQRITATADVLNSEIDKLDGFPGMTGDKTHWTGVWKVNYDESTDAYDEELLSFLVSGLPNEEEEILDAVASYDDQALGEHALLLGAGSVNASVDMVSARKVDIGRHGRYAYWIGDEGVKARINLEPNEDNVSSSSPLSRLKMSAPSETPADVMSGLESLSVENERLRDMEDRSSIVLADDSLTVKQVRDRYHDLTLNSVGLMTSTAEGGLRKDLSLAFELSDDDFNADDFFAGNLDEPSNEYPYLDHKFRYVYNKPFDPADANSKSIRGPTWHVLRNYYRQYLSVNDVQSDPSFAAQADKPLPNQNGWYDVSWSIPSIYSLYWKRYGEPLTTDEPVIPSGWLGQPPTIRPTEGAVTPVVTRVQNIFSLRKVPLTGDERETLPPAGSTPEHTHQLQIVWDPIVTIWNPYNVSLDLEGFIVEIGLLPFDYSIRTSEPAYVFHSTGVEHPGDPSLPKVDGKTSPETAYHESIPFQRLLGHAWDTTNNWEGSTKSIIFRIGESGSPIKMKPGEILVYSLGTTTPISYDGNAAQVVAAEPGFDGNGGFAFNTGLTGSNAQNVELVVESDSNGDEYSSLTYFLVTDWDKVPEGKSALKATSSAPGAVSIGGAWPKQANQSDYGRAPTTGEIQAPFSSLGSSKQPFVQLDYYMKTSDVSREAVALGAYNNPRARTFNPVGKNPKYKTADPVWGFRLHEITSISDVAQVSPDNRGFWGESNAAGSSFVTLFEVPTAPLTSIGQLMHANITFRGHYPLYPVGGSFASPFIPRDQYYNEIPHYDKNSYHTDACIPDVSYLMNDELWDGYFFSSLGPETLPVHGQDTHFGEVAERFALDRETLPNPRIELLDVSVGADEFLQRTISEDGESIAPNAYRTVAGDIGVKGAFNINSTSVEAWKSILSGLRNEAIAYLDPASGTFRKEDEGEPVSFSKFTLPNGSRNDAWRGYSRMSDDEIAQLAEAIVKQIHLRGPFPTLASFINRELTNGETGLAGVIEAAIQETGGINSDHYNFTADADILIYPENINRYGTDAPLSRETAIPGFLTQADILMALGGMLANRSDTFVIRSYGEALDPLSGETAAEAWLEVVVQRVGTPVEPTTMDSNDPDYFTPAVDENGNDHGRTFRILSMRWLNKEDV